MITLVILENNQGLLHRLSKEAVVGAQKLGGSIHGLVIGDDIDSICDEVKGYDLEQIITVNHKLVSTYSSEAFSEVIKQVIESLSPDIIIAGHTYQTRDFMPRVSAKIDIPFIPDIISFEDHNFVKQVINSKLNAIITTESSRCILSFQSAAFNEEEIKLGSCSTYSFDVELDESKVSTISEPPFQEEAGDVDLENADILVSVGRGIEKEQNIRLAFDLAEIIGAEVCASRPVVDNGWIDSYRQVGSSGSNVAPKLYFSLGISGAIQHVVGMKGAKNILAINKDSDAPIFEIAEYAVVGDVLEIIPKLIEVLSAK